MIHKTHFKNIDLFYKTAGQKEKPAIVLIHGYLESMEIFEDLVTELSDKYFLIVPDLPGHGVSGVYAEVHSMEDLAEAVKLILDESGIKRAHVVGHSMGGYVVMAFRALFPESLLSFTLLHSHCYADSEEKKLIRIREAGMVKTGKKEWIVRQSIPRIFATDNLDKFGEEVEKSISIALKSTDYGIVALLNGMKERPDRSQLLRDGGIPSYLIVGMKDNLISHEMADDMMSYARDMTRFDLTNSGHMGFVEEKEEVVRILKEIGAVSGCGFY